MKVLTVGRSPENDIRIDHPSVSRQHLQLVLHDDGMVSIVNISQHSVTLVNGKKIHGEHFLRKGDVVYLGHYPFEWEKYVPGTIKQTGKNFTRHLSFSNYKHPKETVYFTLIAVVASILWLVLASPVLIFVFTTIRAGELSIILSGLGALAILILIAIGVILLVFYILRVFYEAKLLGSSIRVGKDQYPELYEILKKYSLKLQIEMPRMYVVNSEGSVNAMAVKFLRKKYVILYSELVDLMLADNRLDELAFIIGHELGHHFAGHTSAMKEFFLAPGKIVPFVGAAYSRACELTADRVGYLLTGNKHASQNALISMASGSKALSNQNNIQAFIRQESMIPTIPGFIYKIFSSHPRLTKRVLELEIFNA